MNEHIPHIPDYDLIRPIGEGGFGRVWLAKNETTGHLRAVKLVPLGRSGNVDRAGREIMSLTRLEANLEHQHDHLLTIHHVGRTDEFLYYVMELADDVSGGDVSDGELSVEGGSEYRPGSLENRLADGPLSSEECSHHAAGLLAGLASLHASGMVHRDVKPSNCLFVGGELKLADFGLVTNVGPQISRLGTQKYMPPDGRMGPRADVYAAGLVIHEMITGLPAESFPRLGDRAGQIAQDPALCRLVRLTLGACQPDAEQRFPDATAMLDELAADTDAATRSWFSRHKVAAWLVMAIAMLVVVGFFVSPWTPVPRQSTRPTAPVDPACIPVNFITDTPLFGATIYLDGKLLVDAEGKPVTTPCTADGISPGVHQVVLKHDTLPDQELGAIDFSKTREVTAYFQRDDPR